jgi:hypothetical protein
MSNHLIDKMGLKARKMSLVCGILTHFIVLSSPTQIWQQSEPGLPAMKNNEAGEFI